MSAHHNVHNTNTPQQRRKMGAQSGQAIVLIALAMVGLLGMAGLAIDGGSMLFTDRQAQKIADIAAMSAAIAICNGDDPNAAAISVANTNGVSDDDAGTNDDGRDDIIVTRNPDSLGNQYVRVVVRMPRPPMFIQVVYKGALVAEGTATTHCSQSPSVYDGFVLFATSTTCPDTLHVTGSDHRFDGAFWSNNQVQINAGGTRISGSVNHVGLDKPYNDNGGWPHVQVGANPSGPNGYNPARFNAPLAQSGAAIYTTQVRPAPLLFNIDDFRPPSPSNPEGGIIWRQTPENRRFHLEAAGDYNWVDAHAYKPSRRVPKEGIIFVDGNFAASGGSVLRSGPDGLTIVATGTIQLSGPGVELEAYEGARGLQMFSMAGQSGPSTLTDGSCGGSAVIQTPSSHTHFNGLIYAPFGLVMVPTSNVGASNGAIIAYRIHIFVSAADIRYEGSHLPPGDPAVHYVQ